MVVRPIDTAPGADRIGSIRIEVPHPVIFELPAVLQVGVRHHTTCIDHRRARAVVIPRRIHLRRIRHLREPRRCLIACHRAEVYRVVQHTIHIVAAGRTGVVRRVHGIHRTVAVQIRICIRSRGRRRTIDDTALAIRTHRRRLCHALSGRCRSIAHATLSVRTDPRRHRRIDHTTTAIRTHPGQHCACKHQRHHRRHSTHSIHSHKYSESSSHTGFDISICHPSRRIPTSI